MPPGTERPEPEPALGFDALFAREYPKLVALAAAVSGRRTVAEDIAQEAFSRFAIRSAQLSGYDKPGAWLRRVTINLAISRRRRFAAEARAWLRLRPDTEPELSPAPAHHDDLWAAVAALPPRQRAVVALHYLEDRSMEEIAEVLEISASTARVHLHRARQTLRNRLDQEVAR